MAYSYALRFDIGDDEELEAIVGWLTTHGSYIVVREGGADNPHVHALLRTEMIIRSLRNDLRRKLTFLSGNGDYSLTATGDEDKYARYICKGESEEIGPDVVARMGVVYTDAWVVSKHKEWWQHDADYKSRQKRKGLHSATIVEKVLEICTKEKIKWSDERAIGRVYLRLISDAKKGVNIYQLRSTVKGVQLQLSCDGGAEARLLDEAFPGSGEYGFVPNGC